jgi:hypothetical protein
MRDDSDEVVEAGSLTCRARINKLVLRIVQASYVDGFATCVWHVPAKGTARKQVKGVVIVEALGATIEQRFSMNVKRR